ncbi:membrane protein [Tenacibaculum holothuriorum]|uniref:Membrane protein n=1 Tax=Tenacibaculum holothuriorum TaxID=1635173 RepID=A0A1Y2PBR0_9FLAO|nr:OB-fold-containig protein [Tenacibaculum holothuriorum]OSY87914.1 membrane protein [Tenacibaculum holothuriorum]
MTLHDLVFSTINAPLTILLILLAAYRFVTMLFGLDLDFDMDFDIDADFDTDASFDASGLDLEDVSNIELKNETIVRNKRKELKWWQVLLIYFNFAELPFLFTFTSWIFFWWAITVISTYLTGSYDNSFGLIFFFAAIIPALILNKIFTTPFKAVFKKLERKGVSALDLIGRKGELLSNISGNKLGSVKLFVNNDPINIYARSLDGSSIESGKEILIIKESDDKKYYYIQLYK